MMAQRHENVDEDAPHTTPDDARPEAHLDGRDVVYLRSGVVRGTLAWLHAFTRQWFRTFDDHAC
jgi:hypothetical protein